MSVPDAGAHAQVHNFALPKAMDAELLQAEAPDEGDSIEAAEPVTQDPHRSVLTLLQRKPSTEQRAYGMLIRNVQEITQHSSKTCVIEVQAEGSVQQVRIQGRMQEAVHLRVRIAAVKVLAAPSIGTCVCANTTMLVHNATCERGISPQCHR